MKTVLLSIFSMLVCVPAIISNPVSEPIGKYRIYKIDSINNYYFIYAIKGEKHFKIISEKQEVCNAEKIEINGNYDLSLWSWRKNPPVINGVAINSMDMYMDIQWLSLDDSTSVKIDGGVIDDLYFPNNLKGLYLIDEE